MTLRVLGNLDLRRQQIRGLTTGMANGIDFVELRPWSPIFAPVPSGTTPVRGDSSCLIVTFLRPLTGSFLAQQLAQGLIRDNLLAVDTALGRPLPLGLVVLATDGKSLVIELPRGDSGLYTISLVRAPGATTPPTGIDPLLSSVDFASAGLLPSPPRPRPAAPSDGPPIDYRNRDYASLRQHLFDRLTLTAPKMTSGHPAELGTALVEALAYVGDVESYKQDAVGTEAYLGTARHRISVRRHARLIDYNLHEGCNARVLVALKVSAPISATQIASAAAVAPLQFLTRIGPDLVVSAAEANRLWLGGHVQIFELCADPALALYPQHNQIAFASFALPEAWLPYGATEATLVDPGGPSALALRAGDLLMFDPIAPRDGELGSAHVVRLRTVETSQDPLTGQGLIEISWDPKDALPAPLGLVRKLADGSSVAAAVALGNVALADSGYRVATESLMPSSERLPRADLRFAELTHAVPNLDTLRALPAASLFDQDPRQALPQVQLIESDEQTLWQAVRTLLQSSFDSRAFVVEMDDARHARLRFGDGQLGCLPPSSLTASYRAGNGSLGNVAAESIAHVIGGNPLVPLLLGVRNPQPARGGVDPEPLEEARLVAPYAYRVQERAVTAADYEELAQRYPGVQTAACNFRRLGQQRYAVVSVLLRNGAGMTSALRADLTAFLDSFRLIGYEIKVVPPQLVGVDVCFKVSIAPGYAESSVLKDLSLAFGSSELADGRLGFFHPDRFDFGQPLFLGQMLAAAMRVPGVAYVDASAQAPNRFRRDTAGARDEFASGYLFVSPLEVIRLSATSRVVFVPVRMS